MKAPRTIEGETRRVRDFNSTFSVGTVCDYWTMDRTGPPSGTAATRTSAQLGGVRGYAVVWLQGVSGCIALTHVCPRETEGLSAELFWRLFECCPQLDGETPR